MGMSDECNLVTIPQKGSLIKLKHHFSDVQCAIPHLFSTICFCQLGSQQISYLFLGYLKCLQNCNFMVVMAL